MNTKLTKIEKALAYGINLFTINEEDKLTILAMLSEEEDQLLMIYFLKTHPEATEAEIMNACGDILTRRNRLTNS